VDTPPPTRQPKCQAKSENTPTILPSKSVRDANQIAKQTPIIFRGDAKQVMILATTTTFSRKPLSLLYYKVNRLVINELWRQKPQKPTTAP
jgi:hypothetical protein